MSSYSFNSSAAVAGGRSDTAIMAIHPDILRAHVFNRLDGPTLAAAGSASSQLHCLSGEEKLWQHICNSTWPSTSDPLVREAVSGFSSGHRSFFSDSFSTPRHRQRSQIHSSVSPPPNTELISAVDIHYEDKLLFSKVHVTETATAWFLCSPFRVDLLGPKEWIPTPVKFVEDDKEFELEIRECMKLSWILIDPTRNRAVNVSSLRPVWVRKHWLTGDIQVKYSTIMPAGGSRRASAAGDELVQCEVVVTCGGKEGGELHVSEVTMQVEDMDGKIVSGEASLVILQEAMGCERKRRENSGQEMERYEEFLQMKRERKKRKQVRENRLDLACTAVGVIIFLVFWTFILFKI